ncbi:hypothetical protein GUITHDRAFT_101749 [Guillardia theta CCMP2712]|uniref:PDZ domain-containing protein n=1 Tax=Guillardia theta (strain CCMP2712) TaxID=905079 RepID=L1JW67_GUITC|nr:hypothetical protein GUITHDRAFT_101749 [Guillardia theta CCMP2712]EKX52584.1 hypothetical protein GUITHDRAFT_101749 [Guillardia theta CCMP2712]|eukprot:XP_005839564.1 hypothetical protein GUITHDRAFT_101749 [Guillardia theta CCMP2712]
MSTSSVHSGSFRSESDDSLSSSSLSNTYVAKYASEARLATERIRKISSEENVLSDPRPSPRTSLGLHLNGLVVRGIVPGGPAFASKRLCVNDEILSVDGKDATPHNVTKLLQGCDKPGSWVQLRVRSQSSANFQEVDIMRADADEVRMYRTIFENLMLLKEGVPNYSAKDGTTPIALIDNTLTVMNNLRFRHYEEASHVKHANDMKSDGIKASLDEIYIAVGKMEGAYYGVHSRAKKLLVEVQKLHKENFKSSPDLQGIEDLNALRSLCAAQAKELEQLKSSMLTAQSSINPATDMNPVPSGLRSGDDHLHKELLRKSLDGPLFDHDYVDRGMYSLSLGGLPKQPRDKGDLWGLHDEPGFAPNLVQDRFFPPAQSPRTARMFEPEPRAPHVPNILGEMAM